LEAELDWNDLKDCLLPEVGGSSLGTLGLDPAGGLVTALTNVGLDPDPLAKL